MSRGKNAAGQAHVPRRPSARTNGGQASHVPIAACVLAVAAAAIVAYFRLRNVDATEDAQCVPPLAKVLPSAVGADFSQRVFDLAKRVARERPDAVTERNFGVNTTAEGGHRVTFLQHVALAQKAFMAELWAIARRADTWRATSAARRLPLRCMELIEYSSAANHSLGFHHDGDTFLTVAIVLEASAC